MAAVGAGHIMVVEVLLLHKEIQFEMNDSYGMTAVFHTCNHGFSRMGPRGGPAWVLQEVVELGLEPAAVG